MHQVACPCPYHAEHTARCVFRPASDGPENERGALRPVGVSNHCEGRRFWFEGLPPNLPSPSMLYARANHEVALLPFDASPMASDRQRALRGQRRPTVSPGRVKHRRTRRRTSPRRHTAAYDTKRHPSDRSALNRSDHDGLDQPWGVPFPGRSRHRRRPPAFIVRQSRTSSGRDCAWAHRPDEQRLQVTDRGARALRHVCLGTSRMANPYT